MKKLILASTASIAMLGLAACSDTDDTTTQSVPEPAVEAPLEPADDGAAITDDGAAMDGAAEEPVETESVAPEAPEAPAATE